jgi:4-amino-4-deoxy-L-arabinose transferase-like glycosyltransferase
MKIGGIFTDLFDTQRKCKDSLYLAIALACSLLWRLPLIVSPGAIHNDSTEYIRIARLIMKGVWSEGDIPPFYSLLIIGVNFIVGDLELSGIIVSVLSGVILTIPIFYLAKEFYDVRVAFIAALLAAFQPYLYKYAGTVLTESTYALLLVSAVLFGWFAFNRGKAVYALLFGLFTSLAYLTRPEAVGCVVLFACWTLAVSPVGEKRSLWRRAMIAVMAVLFFVVFSSPYLLYLRQQSGRWAISKKVTVSLNVPTDSDDIPPDGKVRKKKKKDVYITSMVKDPLAFGTKVLGGTLESFNKFQQVFAPYLFLLALAGFFRKKGGRRPWRQNGYLLLYLLFYFAFVFPFFWVTQRYTFQMIPLALPWAAYGLEGFSNWVWAGAGRRFNARQVLVAAVAFTVLLLCTHGVIANDRWHRLAQRDVGLWMKKHLTKEGPVLDQTVHVSFYADRGWIPNTRRGYNDIVGYARQKGARYIIIDTEDEPEFGNAFRDAKEKDLLLCFEMDKGKDRVLVFEVLSPAIAPAGSTQKVSR